MPAFSIVTIRKGEMFVLKDVRDALVGISPGVLDFSTDGGALRFLLNTVLRRRGVIIPDPSAALDTGGRFFVALDEQPESRALVWGLRLAAAFVTLVALSQYYLISFFFFGSALLALVLFRQSGEFTQGRTLRRLRRAIQARTGKQRVSCRRRAWSKAPPELQAALFSFVTTPLPEPPTPASEATPAEATPPPEPAPAAAAEAAPIAERHASFAPAPHAARLAAGMRSIAKDHPARVLLPALLGGIFSLTTALIVFILEDGRAKRDESARKHEVEIEEIRSRRASAAEAVRFYFDNRAQLATGDAGARRMMAVLRAIAPSDIYCVLQEAYQGDAAVAPTPADTYSANTMQQLVDIVQKNSFGESANACLGSTGAGKQLVFRAQIRDYPTPPAGEAFARNPSGGGGERLETAAPTRPTEEALVEYQVLMFAANTSAINPQFADTLQVANFHVTGLLEPTALPTAPVIVYYAEEDLAAATLLAAYVDYWTYQPGVKSAVRVARKPQNAAADKTLEVWLPR